MTKRLSLRYRVALGYGLMGLALSAAFAAVTIYVADDYEEIIVAALLEGQADTYLDALAANPRAALPRSPVFSVYRESEAPAVFRKLPPGIHELDLKQHNGLHAGVFQRKGLRLVFVLDVGQIDTLERYLADLMLVVVIGGTLLSAWLGWLLSARTIRPVLRLAHAVEQLPLRPLATTLAADYGRDGIGRLAAAIDRYQQRLVQADVTERQFFADASHELRTPIAVIQGAVEVLRDDPQTSASQGRKLARIDRSIAELAYLLEALLLSARGVPAETDALDLREMCSLAIASLDATDPGASQRVAVEGMQALPLQAPRRWVACILRVLLHRALAASPEAAWIVSVSDAGVAIRQPDPHTNAERIRRSDLGMGFAFVERLARALGWRLEQQVSPDAGLSIWLGLRSGD